MGKRKKRLLFDVFGDAPQSAPPPRPGGRLPSKAPTPPLAREGELRLSYNLAAVCCLLFIVFVGLSYYFGWTHGDGKARGRGETQVATAEALRHDDPGDSERQKVWYAVKARSNDYTRSTYAELKAHLQACRAFLIDEGLKPVALYDYPQKDGTGKLVLWVGKEASKESLGELPRRLRSLKFKDKLEFSSAFAATLK